MVSGCGVTHVTIGSAWSDWGACGRVEESGRWDGRATVTGDDSHVSRAESQQC